MQTPTFLPAKGCFWAKNPVYWAFLQTRIPHRKKAIKGSNVFKVELVEITFYNNVSQNPSLEAHNRRLN
jgi:hypothetical protein